MSLHCAIEAIGSHTRHQRTELLVRLLELELPAPSTLECLRTFEQLGPDLMSIGQRALQKLARNSVDGVAKTACRLLGGIGDRTEMGIKVLTEVALICKSPDVAKEAAIAIARIDPPINWIATVVDRYGSRAQMLRLLASTGEVGRKLRRALAMRPPAAQRRGSTYERRKFLAEEAEKLKPAEKKRQCAILRDHWNGMTEEERRIICASAPQKIGPNRDGADVVRKDLKRFAKEAEEKRGNR